MSPSTSPKGLPRTYVLLAWAAACVCAPLHGERDAGRTDAGPSAPWTAGPVTPPPSDCVSPAWCEGECCHPCVTPSCAQGWCRVPAGCFIYGSPEDEPGHSGRETQVPVFLTQDFVIQQYEMTNAQWGVLGLPPPAIGDFCGPTSGSCADSDCPVSAVNWWEAVEAANRLSTLHGLPVCYSLVGCEGDPGLGMTCDHPEWNYEPIYTCPGYRLPTRAEHQYAVRAGTRTAYYSGDMVVDVPDPRLWYGEDANLDRIAWYNWNSGNTAHVVGQKEPNRWLLYDMSGNAEEWLWDRSGFRSEGVTSLTNPVGWMTWDETHSAGSGAFWSPTAFCRSAAVFGSNPENKCPGDGLRLVRTVTWPEGADTIPDPWVDPMPDPCDVTPADHDPAACPMGSGWPCSCSNLRGTCADGSACLQLASGLCAHWPYGVCMPQCMDLYTSTPCPPAPGWNGSPECVPGFTAEYKGFCTLTCSLDSDCPPDQRCQRGGDYQVCSPYP
jgi:formylglycine-generating enzyme required for sulfatase activity